jgi:hypothetical protein
MESTSDLFHYKNESKNYHTKVSFCHTLSTTVEQKFSPFDLADLVFVFFEDEFYSFNLIFWVECIKFIEGFSCPATILSLLLNVKPSFFNSAYTPN